MRLENRNGFQTRPYGFRFGRASVLFLLAFLGFLPTLQAVPAAPRAPIYNLNLPAAIPNQFIVVFKDGVTFDEVVNAEKAVGRLGGTIGFRYTAALIGFSFSGPASALDAVSGLEGVAWIEADQTGSLATEQLSPPTGLDRTSERLLPLDHRYTYSEGGAGVHAYVLDTGIRVTHADFGTRAVGSFTAILDGLGTDDCHGHGTHVAGTLGGTAYGIAKEVALHAVRVANCFGGAPMAGTIAGVDWVTANSVHPAVANMSLRFAPSPTLDAAVAGSVASGVTYAVAAGNDSIDACNVSPAREPAAITVGAVDPMTDIRPSFSNFGTCLDLFAPGVDIVSAYNSSDTATGVLSGTSMASPHVAGVAARYLGNYPLKTPAEVLAAIHANADIFSITPLWGGVGNPGPGSPNELLHWGSLNDGFNDGDPHLTTIDGVRYDFQGAGEYVMLREAGGLEIQTRQTPVGTASTVGPNAHTGLTSCVSLNSAVAARVGSRRVSFQPNLSGVPNPGGLQLRVDGIPTTLDANGLDLGSGGRLAPSAGGGIEIDFPDGAILVATPGWWAAQGLWYLNLSIFRSSASQGILGAMAPGSWLPALPTGTSMGPRPATLPQRYFDLYQVFGNAWRVTDQSSLFDYASGTSTATFTLHAWPRENAPCNLPGKPVAQPIDPLIARILCRGVTGTARNADCVFDVTVTGEGGFARLYRLSEQLQQGLTTTALRGDPGSSEIGEAVTFTAAVTAVSKTQGIPRGTIRFFRSGVPAGLPVRLDARGQASWTTSNLPAGSHRIAAGYLPDRGTGLLASTSPDVALTIRSSGTGCDSTVLVSGLHYPHRTCADTWNEFLAGVMTSFHFTSACPAGSPLSSVFDVACQDAPIPGFPNGSIYNGTACCGGRDQAPAMILDLPMQGGNEKTPCPPIGVLLGRSDAATVPYLGILLSNLDLQCGFVGPGLLVSGVKFLACEPDPRGFGPNARADVSCAP